LDLGGVSLGWINDDALFTRGGRHVGRVEYDGDETLVFSMVDGHYLGEVREGNHLITNESRMGRRRGPVVSGRLECHGCRVWTERRG
jgi:hypothetical protein